MIWLILISVFEPELSQRLRRFRAYRRRIGK